MIWLLGGGSAKKTVMGLMNVKEETCIYYLIFCDHSTKFNSYDKKNDYHHVSDKYEHSIIGFKYSTILSVPKWRITFIC